MHFEQLQSKIQISFYVRSVNDIYDTVGFFVKYKIAGHNLFLRIRAKRVYSGQIDDRTSAGIFYLTYLAVHRHTGKVSDVLIGACQNVEKRRFSAILIADKSKSHFSITSETSMFLASETRSVSS